MENIKESFIGCTKCYRRKRDCKCSFGDFHRIPERRFDFWKFELVRDSCGKEIRTARTGKDDAVHCGDILYSEIELCSDCKKKRKSASKSSTPTKK